MNVTIMNRIERATQNSKAGIVAGIKLIYETHKKKKQDREDKLEDC